MLGKLLAGRTASTLFTLTIVPGSALLLFLYQGMDPEVASLQEGIDQTMMMLHPPLPAGRHGYHDFSSTLDSAARLFLDNRQFYDDYESRIAVAPPSGFDNT